jgi:hypothetical protein
MSLPTDNYDKNNKPLVKSFDIPAFGKQIYTQGDINKAPITAVTPSLSPFNILTNKVTNADSAKLQKASGLPGRAADGGSINFE